MDIRIKANVRIRPLQLGKRPEGRHSYRFNAIIEKLRKSSIAKKENETSGSYRGNVKRKPKRTSRVHGPRQKESMCEDFKKSPKLNRRDRERRNHQGVSEESDRARPKGLETRIREDGRKRPRARSQHKVLTNTGGRELPPTELCRHIDHLIVLTNRSRAEYGIAPVTMNGILRVAAKQHSQFQARTLEMTHYGEDGLTVGKRALQLGYDYKRCSENVAVGHRSAEQVHKAWLNSESHARNILDDRVRDVGVYVYIGSNGQWYWTEIFGCVRGARKRKD